MGDTLLKSPYIQNFEDQNMRLYIQIIDYIIVSCMYTKLWTPRVSYLDYVYKALSNWKKNDISWVHALTLLYIDKVIEVWHLKEGGDDEFLPYGLTHMNVWGIQGKYGYNVLLLWKTWGILTSPPKNHYTIFICTKLYIIFSNKCGPH